MAELTEELRAELRKFKGQRIGRILRKMGVVNRNQVQEALELQKTRRLPFGQVLIELGYADDDQINHALAIQAGMEMFDLHDYHVADDVVALMPAQMALTYQVVPLRYDKEKNTLMVAVKDASNFQAVDSLRLLMGFNVTPVVGKREHVEAMLQKYYGGDNVGTLTTLIAEIESDQSLSQLEGRGASIDLDSLVEAAEDNKVKRLLNLVLMQAIKDRASDIHLEPFEAEFRMRYRVDGQMLNMVPPPKYLANPIVSRIKVMANLDIAEHRVPQDGRIELTVGGEPVDLRVSVLPTMSGESVVMRILDRGNVQLSLDRIGMRPEDLDRFRQLISKPNGIVIVTGPTGSGKTTTLYAALNELNQPDVKILTTEEPVEYPMEGMCQVPINPVQGMTFAAALRSFLRQDPDIILVGETRDKETAGIAIEAALTGHLVFTTLHTNDAAGAVARLLDLGIENFLVTATTEGAQAQRLVKRICDRCKQPYEITEQEIYELQLDADEVAGRQVYRGKGCDYCNGTGYRKRTGIFEILLMDDTIRQMILDGASTQMINDYARQNGMRTLRDAGLMTMWEGITTTDEILTVTMAT